MFRRSKERMDGRQEDFKSVYYFLGQKVCREAFMIITGIHAEAIQRARMLAQGIAPLTLGKWVSERSLSYRQCRAWLLDYAKVHEACGSETGSDAKVHEACGSETPAVAVRPQGGHEQGPLRGQVAATDGGTW